MLLGVCLSIFIMFLCGVSFLFKCPHCGKYSNMLRVGEGYWVCWRCGREW